MEDIRAESNTFAGIQVFGSQSIVGNCWVIDTGGCTVPANAQHAFGINTAGKTLQIINNSVASAFATAPGGFASGIQSDQSDATIFNNRVIGVSGGATNYGILCNGGGVTPLIRDKRRETLRRLHAGGRDQLSLTTGPARTPLCILPGTRGAADPMRRHQRQAIGRRSP